MDSFRSWLETLANKVRNTDKNHMRIRGSVTVVILTSGVLGQERVVEEARRINSI